RLLPRRSDQPGEERPRLPACGGRTLYPVAGRPRTARTGTTQYRGRAPGRGNLEPGRRSRPTPRGQFAKRFLAVGPARLAGPTRWRLSESACILPLRKIESPLGITKYFRVPEVPHGPDRMACRLQRWDLGCILVRGLRAFLGTGDS